MLDTNNLISPNSSGEAARLTQRAESVLAVALLSGNPRPVRAALSFLKLKYPVSYPQLARIAELLFALFEKCCGDVANEADVAVTLAFVLKQLNKHVDCPPIGSEKRVTIPWRPLRDALLRVQMHGCTWEEYSLRPPVQIPIGAEARKAHGQALVNLCRRARSFFTAQAATEIFESLRPFLCPHENSLFRAVGLLCLLLPENINESLLKEVTAVWEWIPNCIEWTYLWIHFFSRLLRHSHAVLLSSFQPSLPRLFQSLTFTLNLPSSKDNSQRPDLLVWPPDCSFLLPRSSHKTEAVKKMTRLIVFSYAPHSCTKDLLIGLVQYLTPFYHPLNEGDWTSSLDMLLKMLTLNFSKRIGFESGAHKAKRPWQPLSPLTESDVSEFVQLLLPLALTAFESKDHSMSHGASQALKDLVSMQPVAVLPMVLDRLLPAIENSMKPHETLNAMETFSVILGSLLRSEGGLESTFLAQMLQQTLPGIDNNDPMKTFKTLRLYMRVITLMPLVHPSDMPGTKPEFVYIIPDWAVGVVDGLWKLLCNVPSMKKGSGLDYVLSKNTIRQFLDNFLQQMSPTLYETVLKQLCQKVATTFYPPGKKYFGQFLNAAVYANPASLKELIPLLRDKILHKNNVELVGNGSETAYWVHLLGHVVSRGGEHLLAYSPVLDSILDAVVFHEEKELRKAGQKLLRKLLRSYLLVLPEDVRTLAPVEWNFAKCDNYSRLAHPAVDPSTVSIQFKVPTPSVQDRARSVVEKFFSMVTSKLHSSGTTLAPASVRSAIGCLEAIARGGATLFPAKEATFHNISADISGFEIDEDEGNVGLASPFTISNVAWGEDFRKKLGDALHHLCGIYANRENPDVVTIKGLIRVVHVFLSYKGYKQDEHDHLNHTKGTYRLWDKGFSAAYTRNMVVLKAQTLLNRRMAAGVLMQDADSEKLLTHLLTFCTHEYSLVRKKAQKVLPVVLRRYPRFSKQVLSSALSVFGRRESTRAAVNGAIYTVNTAPMLKRIARQWEHVSDLIVGLLSSHHFPDIKVQVRLAELWNSFVPYTSHLIFSRHVSGIETVLELPAIKSLVSPEDAKAAVAKGFDAKNLRRTTEESIYDHLVTVIESAMYGNVKLHWRFVLLGASSLSILLRRDKAPSRPTLDFFLQGLVSEVLPLRQLCRGALPRVVNCYTQSDKNTNSCPMETETELRAISFKDLDCPLGTPFSDGPFADCLWRAWNGPVDPTEVLERCFASGSTEVQNALDEFLKNPENVSRLCELMATDHRLSGDERATDSESGIPGMPLPSAAVLGLFDGCWQWPRTPVASFSPALNKSNLIAFETLLRAGGAKARDSFWPLLQKSIAKHDDREQQCLAAELLVGFVRASICWDTSVQNQLGMQVEALLSVSWQNLAMEAASDWMEALRFMVCNRDPRRFQWLGRCAANLTSSVDAPTSTILNGLKLQQSLLIEFSWKGYSFASAITPRLLALLGRSSKSIREEAGRCLVLVSQIDSCHPSSPVPFRPCHLEAVPCSREILMNSFPSMLQRVLSDYASSNTEPGDSDNNKGVRQEIEGILYFFIHASRVGRSSSTGPYVATALTLMLAAQEDADREFAQIGKIASQLVCCVGPPIFLEDSFNAAKQVYLQSSSWRVRIGAIDAIRILAHRAVLDVGFRTRCLSICQQALEDQNLEVRQFAQMCFAGLLRMSSSEEIRALISATPKSRKRSAKKSGDASENTASRHSKVLAVAAAIRSHPTGIPEWMADAVTSLCVLDDEDPVIKQTIVSTIGEFKKTHQDMWPLICMTWTSDQVALVSEFVGARSYYS